MAAIDVPAQPTWSARSIVARLIEPGRRGTTMLTVGTLASGVLAYAFNALAARALGPAEYGPIAVLWATLFLVSVVLFRPIEQTLSRGIAERVAHGQDARPVVHSTVRLAAVVAAVAAVAVLLGWDWIGDRLFAGHDVLTLALALGIAGYALSFIVRGLASGLSWFGGYGLLLLADGGIRVALALPLFFVASPAVAAAALAVAAVGGAVVPFLHRVWRNRRHGDAPILGRLEGAAAGAFQLRHALAFAAPALVIAAADQILVSGGALLVVLAGGPGAAAAAGTVFAATMLVRAPVFLFQGFAAALLPTLTMSQALGAEAAFRRRILKTTGVLLAFAAALTAGTAIAGVESMRILYGAGFEVDRLDLTILATGVGFYLAGATLSQAVLARGMGVTAAAVWGAGAVTFVAIELLLHGSPLHRVSLAFAGAALLIAAVFLIVVFRASPTRTWRPDSRPRNGGT